MAGVIGVGFLNPIVTADEILKAKEQMQESADFPAPEQNTNSMSETSTVLVT